MPYEKAHYGPRRVEESRVVEPRKDSDKVLWTKTLNIKRSHLLFLSLLATTGGFTGVSSFIKSVLNEQSISKTNSNVAETKQDTETVQKATYKAADKVVDELAEAIKKLEDANNANLEKDREQDELLVELKDPEAKRYKKKRKPIPPPVVTPKPSLPVSLESAVVEQKAEDKESTQEHPSSPESTTPQ